MLRNSFAALLLALTTTTSTQANPPNVVVIFIDDMGYADPSCFGNPAMRTPNIDRLASEGIRLTNFYVNSPICSASRVALTTGRYPQRYRIHSFLASRQSNRDRKMPDWLDPRAPTLAKLLKSKGYRTAHFGKWHMGGGRDVGDAPLPQAYGFQDSLVSFEGLGDRILWQKTGNQELSWKHGRGQILDLPKHKTTETYVDRAIEFLKANRTGEVIAIIVNLFGERLAGCELLGAYPPALSHSGTIGLVELTSVSIVTPAKACSVAA